MKEMKCSMSTADAIHINPEEIPRLSPGGAGAMCS